MNSEQSFRAGDPLRVALVMVAMGDLSGSGGAERQFSDLFEHLRSAPDVKVQLLTSASSVRRLHEAGKLDRTAAAIELPLGSRPGQSKPGIAWMTLVLLFATVGRGLDVVHICLPTPGYVPYVALIARLPRRWRPAVTLTVIDCTVAPNLISGAAADVYEQQVVDAHRLYARWTQPDGVFSWYDAFTSLARSFGSFAHSRVVSARYCFTDPVRFQPGTKERLVVWAGRLSTQKRPLLFVAAVAALVRQVPELLEDWHFEMYGAGALEAQVRAAIREHRLEQRLTLTKAPDLAPVFARSRLFVSTQAHENFTSLAMLEAMAAGNAIVAEAVGQTAEFVHHGRNGFTVAATPEAIADAIAQYLRSPERHAAMADYSRALTTDVHTIKNFSTDIAAFWAAVTQRQR